MSALLASLALTALAQSDVVAKEAPSVRLIVMLAVDQMVPDQLERLAPWLTGGFSRFTRDGLVFTEAALQHGDTETGPGHTCYGTGLHPTHHGIVSNDWIGIDAKDSTYCYGDRNVKPVTSAGVLDSGSASPANLRANGMADFVEAANANAKTFAISSKDRSGIGMTGRKADLVLWWDKRRGGFQTSTWYANTLPPWVAEWNSHWLERLRTGEFAGTWKSHLPEHFEASGTAPDERDGELGKPGQRAFPHASPDFTDGLGEKELARAASWVYDGPAGDGMVLALAEVALDALELGRDDDVDLLSISLSSCDTVGHGYGPRSVEVTDVLLRADRDLEHFFAQLDAKVGKGRWIASLSADHGVLELPETLAAAGYPSRRISGRVIGDSIKAARNEVAKKYGQDFYLTSFARGVRLSWSKMKEAGVDAAEVRKLYATSIAANGTDWIEHALTFDQLKAIARDGAPADGLLRMEANSFDEERTCDVVLLQKPWCLAGLPFGTTHGTPFPYDRAVPLAFYGPGFAPGRSFARAASVDAVPTLLSRAHLPVPSGLDGRDLLAKP